MIKRKSGPVTENWSALKLSSEVNLNCSAFIMYSPMAIGSLSRFVSQVFIINGESKKTNKTISFIESMVLIIGF